MVSYHILALLRRGGETGVPGPPACTGFFVRQRGGYCIFCGGGTVLWGHEQWILISKGKADCTLRNLTEAEARHLAQRVTVLAQPAFPEELKDLGKSKGRRRIFKFTLKVRPPACAPSIQILLLTSPLHSTVHSLSSLPYGACSTFSPLLRNPFLPTVNALLSPPCCTLLSPYGALSPPYGPFSPLSPLPSPPYVA